ncbi:hypothetical protein TSA6c_21935 [Azospirillum sp. TSA6c]|nr:hypothetical protein TSA6c_21935 [Azospirillum sp. TSA6c]
MIVAMGSGLIGGCARRRPTPSGPVPSVRASSSAVVALHMRPWQRPMPARVSALARFISRACPLRATSRTVPAVMPSQRQIIVSSAIASAQSAGKGKAADRLRRKAAMRASRPSSSLTRAASTGRPRSSSRASAARSPASSAASAPEMPLPSPAR